MLKSMNTNEGTKTKSLAKSTRPAVKVSRPVTRVPPPVVSDLVPVVSHPLPVVSDLAPVVSDPAPVVSDLVPVASNLAPVVKPKSPPLRKVSLNIAKQKYGDCFAHTISRILVKYFRTIFPEELELRDEKCFAFYLDTTAFYDCKAESCGQRLTLKDLQAACGSDNPNEMNNLILYMFFYSLCVKLFGCKGYVTYNALSHILYGVLYNPAVLNMYLDHCLLLPELCEQIRGLLNRFCDNLQTLSFNLCKVVVFYYVDDRELFWELIKDVIDANMYLGFGIPIYLLNLKTQKINSRAHAVTIVDYDYSNPSERYFTIKNSKGESYREINITESDLEQPLKNDTTPLRIYFIYNSRATPENQSEIKSLVLRHANPEGGGNKRRKRTRKLGMSKSRATRNKHFLSKRKALGF